MFEGRTQKYCPFTISVVVSLCANRKAVIVIRDFIQVASLADRLREAMNMKNKKQVDLERETGINRSAISRYLSGEYEPKNRPIYELAKALDVSEQWLMGYDVPMERPSAQKGKKEFEKNPENGLYPNLIPITTKSFPVLGDIACGKPIMANEEKELYVEAGTDVFADFCLRAKGDSMVGARIYDGDIVFIRKQEIVDNGDIAAVIIEDEASLKRVNYFPEKNLLILKAENAKYADLVYTGEDLNHIRILGRAVAFQSDIR